MCFSSLILCSLIVPARGWVLSPLLQLPELCVFWCVTDGIVGIREHKRLICRQLERIGRKTWEGKVLSNKLGKWVINSKYLKIISSLKVELNFKVITWLAVTARPCRLVTQLCRRSWEGERLLGPFRALSLWVVIQLCVVVKETVCPGTWGVLGWVGVSRCQNGT